MHDHNNKSNKWMMWMMVLCFVLPLLIFFFGARSKTFGASSWLVFGIMAVFMIAHFILMGRHRHSDKEKMGTNTEDKNDTLHSGHGCH